MIYNPGDRIISTYNAIDFKDKPGTIISLHETISKEQAREDKRTAGNVYKVKLDHKDEIIEYHEIYLKPLEDKEKYEGGWGIE